MKSLSIVIVGRNDGYGDDKLTPYNAYTPDTFCFRLKRTAEHNIRSLTSRGIDLQYIIVDWCPLSEKTLYQDKYVDELLKTYGKNIKYLIVHGDVVKNRGWNPKNFYEYYAKNVGIRNSDSDYIIVTNPDDLFSDELCDDIFSVLCGDFKNEYYRPFSRKDVDNELKLLAEGFSFPKTGLFVDEVLGTPAAGDFLMATKEIFIKFAQGFDESFNTDPNKQQTSLDGNIVLNLYNADIKPICLKGSVLHLDHAKPHQKDYIPMKTYSNVHNWGMLEVEIKTF